MLFIGVLILIMFYFIFDIIREIYKYNHPTLQDLYWREKKKNFSWTFPTFKEWSKNR